ncbi:MAG: DUF938 domain-containing protein [Burkholderiaceae bacterium]
MDRQFSPACERNRAPILERLRPLFADRRRVLEIGSGTGQHAVHFGAALPHLQWQTSDLEPNHASIRAWQQEARLSNVLPPLLLDLRAPDWPHADFDAVFTANTCHIMGWEEVERMFSGVGRLLPAGGLFCVYGPFNYGGRFTSASNAEFDAALRARDPRMGLRDAEAVGELAAAAGLLPQEDHAMPANNRLLVWRCAG